MELAGLVAIVVWLAGAVGIMRRLFVVKQINLDTWDLAGRGYSRAVYTLVPWAVALLEIAFWPLLSLWQRWMIYEDPIMDSDT